MSFRRTVRFGLFQLLSKFMRPKDNPILIFGNQKSGTSAICALLSQATGQSATLDIVRAIPNGKSLQYDLKHDDLTMRDVIQLYAYEFSKPIVKEPFLTLFYDDVVREFPNTRKVFVIRNPFDNIRSILNLYSLDGTMDDWSMLQEKPDNMSESGELIVDSDWITDQISSNPIESMAHRWCYCAEKYLNNKDDEMLHLVKYEDFVLNKKGYIETLSCKLSLEPVNDISGVVDVQYQPKGCHSLDLKRFFGEKNFQRIDQITKDIRGQLGYL